MSYLHTHFPNGFPEMNLYSVTEAEIISTINKLKSKSSSGYDGITNKIKKLCKQQIRKPLTYVINKSLTMGVYPERLKYVTIKSVYKKGESNYRPISIVTGFAKVFETAIFRRLKDHIATHKILLPEQYGFQKGLSTEDAIYELTNAVLTAWNRKEYAVGIFCDIAKMFDCVNHELLLMKLQYYGVHGVLLQLV
jgi:hypothetical protein